ncbi:MAG TPA: prepilin-type N-terminal cleavage/methylation domain-containing protein [Phycisphaerae bacterium]|nr:prepilin-type N-terminal cleavage/methylation domain-containing protein [Phycisphaerales bacterium]HRX83576.1 prepilin-type N-terminal cleavage/methylation domain-containing protein [Phycisphaerae bacterium]
MRRTRKQPAFTLLEILLVLGLLAILSAFVMPAMISAVERERLPESARQLRALIQLTRANAMYEGRRYRIRFPREDEIDGQGTQIQPLVEVERDPLTAPEEFTPVLASWAQDETLQRGIRCARVRLGKPTVDLMMGKATAEDLARNEEQRVEQSVNVKFDEGFPPLIIDADGTCAWATFLLTDAPKDEDVLDVDPRDTKYAMLDVIVDGLTGLAWLQRPLYQEELEMMKEHNWPPVLRHDFLNPRALTEDNVLEVRMNPAR